MSFTYVRSASGGWSQNWEREARQSKQIRENMVKMHDNTVAMVGGKPYDDDRSLGVAIHETISAHWVAASACDMEQPRISCPHDLSWEVTQMWMGCHVTMCRSCHAALLHEYPIF